MGNIRLARRLARWNQRDLLFRNNSRTSPRRLPRNGQRGNISRPPSRIAVSPQNRRNQVPRHRRRSLALPPGGGNRAKVGFAIVVQFLARGHLLATRGHFGVIGSTEVPPPPLPFLRSHVLRPGPQNAVSTTSLEDRDQDWLCT
jgi:hypothetical protein